MQNQEIVSNEIKDRINNILQNYSGAKENIAYCIYEEIASQSGHKPEALEYFYERAEDVKSEGGTQIKEIFTDEEKFHFVLSYGKLIDGALDVLLQKNCSCTEFYAELWDFIEHNTILTEKKQKAFALYYIWIDARIPYYQLDAGIRMDNTVYKETIEKLKPMIKKARFILYTPTAQRTERASRLLKLLEGVENEDEKAVLMAQILAMIEVRNEGAAERRRSRGMR